LPDLLAYCGRDANRGGRADGTHPDRRGQRLVRGPGLAGLSPFVAGVLCSSRSWQTLESHKLQGKDHAMIRPARKALIIGCGIAGPVVALFLQQAGIEVEIYEARAASTDYGGSFLNLASNGLGVLKQLGLDERVESQGSPIPRMLIWNGNGK